jgi:hypothetical protein
MTPHDQQRLAALISEFIDGCGFDPPLHVIAIGSNGSISVSRQTIPASSKSAATTPRT